MNDQNRSTIADLNISMRALELERIKRRCKIVGLREALSIVENNGVSTHVRFIQTRIAELEAEDLLSGELLP